MGTLNLKSGLSPAVWGAGVGLVIVVMAHVLTSASGGLIQPISGSFFAFLGSYFGFFFTKVGGLIILIATILIYIIGTISVQGADGDEPTVTSVMRGLLIGIGTAMNGVLAYNIYGVWFGQTVGLIIAIVLFLLGIISAFSEVSQSRIYQGFIGWLCWLAPMSWPVLGVGLIFLVLSLVLGLVGLFGVDLLKIGGEANADASIAGKIAQANWSTGTFFLVGGLILYFNNQKTAYDMGNVGFIHRGTDEDHGEHESGHNLNLFVLGWIAHYIGAIDENVPVIGHGAQALTELLAESHATRGGRPKLEMWD